MNVDSGVGVEENQPPTAVEADGGGDEVVTFPRGKCCLKEDCKYPDRVLRTDCQICKGKVHVLCAEWEDVYDSYIYIHNVHHAYE
jgi:hypothetical protein